MRCSKSTAFSGHRAAGSRSVANLCIQLALISLGTGLLLGVLSPWGLFTYWWVTIKLAITAALTAVVWFVLVPRLSAAADTVTGPASHILTSAERLPLAIAPVVASTLLLLAVVLAIFKPGWRLRRNITSQQDLATSSAG